MVPIGEARDLYKQISKGISQAMAALKVFQDNAITPWALADNRHLQFRFGAIWEAVITQAYQVTVKLVVPHSSFPALAAYSLISS